MGFVLFGDGERLVAADRFAETAACGIGLAFVEFEHGEAHLGVGDIGGEHWRLADLRSRGAQHGERAFRARPRGAELAGGRVEFGEAAASARIPARGGSIAAVNAKKSVFDLQRHSITGAGAFVLVLHPGDFAKDEGSAGARGLVHGLVQHRFGLFRRGGQIAVLGREAREPEAGLGIEGIQPCDEPERFLRQAGVRAFRQYRSAPGGQSRAFAASAGVFHQVFGAGAMRAFFRHVFNVFRGFA